MHYGLYIAAGGTDKKSADAFYYFGIKFYFFSGTVITGKGLI